MFSRLYLKLVQLCSSDVDFVICELCLCPFGYRTAGTILSKTVKKRIVHEHLFYLLYYKMSSPLTNLEFYDKSNSDIRVSNTEFCDKRVEKKNKETHILKGSFSRMSTTNLFTPFTLILGKLRRRCVRT